MFKIIPAIDLINEQCVRLEQGDFNRQTTYSSNPIEVAEKWEKQGAQLIHIVDLDGAKTGKLSHLPLIKSICERTTCQCELGGGIRSIDDVKGALSAGIDRVILGTVLGEDPEIAQTIINEFDANQIVAGLDAHNGKVSVRGWQTASSFDVTELALVLFEKGIRHYIYTDISTDGMFTGPNYEAVNQLCNALPDANIIASGGVGSKEHIEGLLNLKLDNLDGVIVGKALYDGRVNYTELLID